MADEQDMDLRIKYALLRQSLDEHKERAALDIQRVERDAKDGIAKVAESSTSSLQSLETRMNEKFVKLEANVEEVKKSVGGVEETVAELSTNVTKVITKIESAWKTLKTTFKVSWTVIIPIFGLIGWLLVHFKVV